MTHLQRGMLTFTGAGFALAMFTVPVKISRAQENPLEIVKQRQQNDRERFARAQERELEEFARTEASLDQISKDRKVWRIFWLRKAHAERRWRRDYLEMIRLQEREQRELAERVARGVK